MYGIDSAPHAVQAKLKLDRVWNMPIEEALGELEDASFDCIVTADILEHLVDPWTVLAQLRRKLAPNGTLLASIPNVANWTVISNLIQGDWRYETEGLLDRTHLRFFTRRSLQELFWTSGLTIVNLQTNIRGTPLPPALTKAFKASGIRADALESEGRVLQYLVLAKTPVRSLHPPRVGIVILNWNGRDDTLECLRSVRGLEYPKLDVVVVDNGSCDGSVSAVRAGFPEVTVLELPDNRGRAEGNNVGIRHALSHGAEHVLILNNDTVVDPNMLTRLLDAAALAPNAGLWGPKICYYSRPDTVWRTGYNWDPTVFRFVAAGREEHEAQVSTVHEVDSLVGCAMLISRDVFQAVGMLDSSYFLYWEELDFCARARRQGFRCVVAPEAKVWHKVITSPEGEPSPVAIYFQARNYLLWTKRHLRAELRGVRRFILRREWASLFQALFGTGPSRLRPKEVYWWLLTVHHRFNDPKCRVHLRGLVDYLLGRFGNCPDAVRRWESERVARSA